MTLSPEQKAHIRLCAERATSGPWFQEVETQDEEGPCEPYETGEIHSLDGYAVCRTVGRQVDCAHIAASALANKGEEND